MAEAVHLLAIERILSSLGAVGEFRLSSFTFGRPGASIHERNLGTDVYANRREFIRALLFVRTHGASYLSSLSIGEIWSRVSNFITDNFWYIAQDTFGQRIEQRYSEVVSGTNKIELANALASSPLFITPDLLSLYPLLSVRCESSFDCDKFFFVAPAELTTERIWRRNHAGSVDGRTVPPFAEWDGRRRSVASWLGVHAALPPIALKIASAILGGVALTQVPRLRHLFSGREIHGGVCTISDRWTYSPSDDPHTPPLMNDIVLTEVDHRWLNSMAELLHADDLHSRRRRKALEYFYRAWFLDPRERFPVLCMSLDSLVGATRDHTASAVRFVTELIPNIEVARLRLLMRIRGAVIHGAAPDVYDSENYGRYYTDYEADPIRDLELLVSKSLREDIFGGALQVHDDPDSAVIEQMQQLGRLPANLDDGQIISDDL